MELGKQQPRGGEEAHNMDNEHWFTKFRTGQTTGVHETRLYYTYGSVSRNPLANSSAEKRS